jgi:hypothetical protein
MFNKNLNSGSRVPVDIIFVYPKKIKYNSKDDSLNITVNTIVYPLIYEFCIKFYSGENVMYRLKKKTHAEISSNFGL